MYSRYQRAAVREANFIKYFESSEEDYGEEEEDKEKKEGEQSEEGSEASGSEEASSDEESSSDDESPAGRRKYTRKVSTSTKGGKPGKALVQTNLKQYAGPAKRGGRQPTAA